jgi:hemolysin D
MKWRTALDFVRSQAERMAAGCMSRMAFLQDNAETWPALARFVKAWRAARAYAAGLIGREPEKEPPAATGRALVPFAPPQRRPSDREFLPAALEILDTPPSPIHIALIWFICLAFATALLWSYFGWIDIHAIAQGRIQPSGRSKVVQPLEPGKVAAIGVENGSRVLAGDLLMELDPTDTTADRETLARDLEAIDAETLRRRTAITAARWDAPRAEIAFPADTNESVRARETNVLNADLAQLASSRESVRGQMAEKAAQKTRFEMSVAAGERLFKVLKERVDMRDSLRAKEYGSRAAVIDALQEMEREATILANDRGQALEAAAAIGSLERKLVQMTDNFIADQAGKLADAERKRDRTAQELVKARGKSERTRLRAPISGTIQQLAVTTIGQVVSSGQALMTIVPLDVSIEVEAMILNQDIGFVEPGQIASVKVEAFPFTRYGAVEATVVKVARDAVDERAAAGLSDATAASKPQTADGTSSRMQSLVFPAILSLNRTHMDIDGKTVPLSAGMAVTVEIKTGARRAIDYVMSPLREITARAGHER